MREATRAFNVACIEMENFEADDLIATYAKQAREKGAKVTIVSSDKDLMQLVGNGVALFDAMKDRVIDEDAVAEKFGVGPDKVIEVQALAGDSSDNVPGVPGIGVKTAAQLIGEYGDLENLLSHAEEIKQPKRRQSLIDHAEMARVSKKLVTPVRRRTGIGIGRILRRRPTGARSVARLPARQRLPFADSEDRKPPCRRDRRPPRPLPCRPRSRNPMSWCRTRRR